MQIAVIGAGSAGCAAAVALAASGHDVTVLDASAGPCAGIGEVVPPEITPALRTLGAAGLAEDGHLPITGVTSAWGSAEPHETDYVCSPHGCGWSLDRERWQARLVRAATGRGARVLFGHRVSEVRREGGGWEVRAGAAAYRADFLVAASGRAAAVLGLLGRRLGPRPTIAALAYFSAPSDETRLRIEAAPEGWWYTAPLPFGRQVVGHVTRAEMLPAPNERRRAIFRERLARHAWAPRVPADAEIRFAPAATSRAERVAGEGWLAIGDAALALDPLSGQGIFRAITEGSSAPAWLARDPADYAEKIGNDFSEAMKLGTRFYAAERRWADEPFWKMQRAAAAEPGL